MKIRSGFVSNSSSSSFIVKFDTEELTLEYLKEKLFSGVNSVQYMYNWGDNNISFSADELCNYILCSFKKVETKEELYDAFDGLSSYDDPRIPENPNWIRGDDAENERRREIYEKERQFALMKIIKEFTGKDSGNIFVAEIGDDSQIGAQIEHGDTFAPVPHIRVNNH